MRREHGEVETDVGAERDLDDARHPVRGERPYLLCGVVRAVVDRRVRTGRPRQLGLVRRAGGGDHPGAAPAGQGDRRVADGARAAGDQDVAAQQRTVGEQAVPGRHRRDPQARTDVVGHLVGQPDRLARRHDGPLRGAAPLPATGGGEPDPDPLPDAAGVHALADGVDLPGSVLAGDLEVAWLRGGPHLPVGRVDPGDVQADPHLTRSGLRCRDLLHAQDPRSSGRAVDGCEHRGTSFAHTLGATRPATADAHPGHVTSPARGCWGFRMFWGAQKEVTTAIPGAAPTSARAWPASSRDSSRVTSRSGRRRPATTRASSSG